MVEMTEAYNTKLENLSYQLALLVRFDRELLEVLKFYIFASLAQLEVNF